MNNLKLNSILNKNLLNNLFEGIFIVDNDKKIIFMNKQAELITGYIFEEVENKNYLEVMKHYTGDDEKVQKDLLPIQLALKNKSITRGNMHIYNKNGEKLPVKVNVMPTFDKNNEINGAIEFFLLDSSYLELKKTNQSLKNLNNIKSQFLGMAAHDLNNPLTAIQGFNSFLLNMDSKNLTYDQISMLNKIDTNCIKMSKIINYFLDLSRVALNKIDLNVELITIENLLNLDNFSFFDLSVKKGINLIVNIELDIPQLNIDKDKMIQVIENLVINAIKFSKSNTTIIIEAKKKDNDVVISIIDQGVGIPEKDLDTIFDAFTTSAKTTSGEKSTGLGLLIVKKLVELHKGEISVSSIPDVGSVFSITLPSLL